MQMCSLLFFVTVYAAAVYAQFTVGERGLRQLGATGFLVRAALSVVHAALGYGASLAVGIQLSAMVYGDYRRGILGPYTFPAIIGFGLLGVVIPWLPLLVGWLRVQRN
jgi:hypothetical protein